MIRVFFG